VNCSEKKDRYRKKRATAETLPEKPSALGNFPLKKNLSIEEKRGGIRGWSADRRGGDIHRGLLTRERTYSTPTRGNVVGRRGCMVCKGANGGSNIKSVFHDSPGRGGLEVHEAPEYSRSAVREDRHRDGACD